MIRATEADRETSMETSKKRKLNLVCLHCKHDDASLELQECGCVLCDCEYKDKGRKILDLFHSLHNDPVKMKVVETLNNEKDLFPDKPYIPPTSKLFAK